MGTCSLSAQFLLATGVFAATSFLQANAASAPSYGHSSSEQKALVIQHFAELPLSFEANRGQAYATANFVVRGFGYGLYLTGDGAVVEPCRSAPIARRSDDQFPAHRLRHPGTCDALRMRLQNASAAATPVGEDELPGTVNYFVGNDPSLWRTHIPTFARVRYRDVYPGIDILYYGNHRQLEYDFVVAPGAEPSRIGLQFDAATSLRRSVSGDLVVSGSGATMTFRRPAIYQVVDGHRVSIAGEFALAGAQTVRFQIGRYDRTRPLIIDPVLVYSTFLGGSGAANSAFIGGSAAAIAIDSQGSTYVTGETLSTTFPVTQGTFQSIDPAAANQTFTAFVSKLNAAGTALIYSTYLGGSSGDEGNAIAVDANGDAYVTGSSASLNFPVTPGALQTTNKGASSAKATAFVTELNPSGANLIYSTYLGGSTFDGAAAVAVDAEGNAYVAGQTSSTDFPVTQGAFQMTSNATAAQSSNAFVAKLNPSGSALVYSTYLGGSGGPSQSAMEGGCIAADSKANGLLGSGLADNQDGAFAIAIDGSGDAYVAGQALSANFPVTQDAFQAQNNGASTNATNAFVAKLNPAGSALLYSTYLGGSGTSCSGSGALGYNGDVGLALALDSLGNAYVSGVTFSKDFPVTQGAFQTTNRFSYKAGPGPTAFVSKLNSSGSALVYSTYLGGSGGFINISPFFAQTGGDLASGLAVDSLGDAYVTGSTASADFPVTAGAVQSTNSYVVSTGACGNSCPNGTNGYNAFVTELNPTGSALLYSTYLGGNGANSNVESSERAVATGDVSGALALDGSGNVYIAGQAESATFPVTTDAFQTTIPALTSAVISKLALGPPGSGFTITGTPATVAVGATSGNTSTITVTPLVGFTGSVALTAAITAEPAGAVNPPTFTFGSTTPVAITGSSAGSATLTIDTTTAAGCQVSNMKPQQFPWPIPGGATLAVLVLVALPRRRQWSRWLALVLLAAGLVASLSACGSGSQTKTCGTAFRSPTTAGAYTVVITGTSGASSASGAITLTVE
jgi:hypothetical protein